MSRSTIRTAVLTISDRCSRGERIDESGPLLERTLAGWGRETETRDILPDDEEAIAHRLAELADGGIELILTTGGTGLGPRDRTPEATMRVADRLVPGLPEWIRRQTGDNPRAYLSRGVAAIRGRCLVLNLPGSPRGAVECLTVAWEILQHALEVIGETPASPVHPDPAVRPDSNGRRPGSSPKED